MQSPVEAPAGSVGAPYWSASPALTPLWLCACGRRTQRPWPLTLGQTHPATLPRTQSGQGPPGLHSIRSDLARCLTTCHSVACSMHIAGTHVQRQGRQPALLHPLALPARIGSGSMPRTKPASCRPRACLIVKPASGTGRCMLVSDDCKAYSQHRQGLAC